MTIAFVGAGSFATGTGNLNPTLHGSTQPGDLLVAHANKRASDQYLEPSSGWVELHLYDPPTSNASLQAFYGKIAGESEPNPTFTADGNSPGTMQVLSARSTLGWDLGAIVNAAVQKDTDSGADILAQPITPSVDNCIVLYSGKRRDTDNALSAGALSGLTEIGQAVTGTTNALLTVWNYVIQTTAAQVDPVEWVISDAVGNGVRASIAVALMEASGPKVTNITPTPLVQGGSAVISGIRFGPGPL